MIPELPTDKQRRTEMDILVAAIKILKNNGPVKKTPLFMAMRVSTPTGRKILHYMQSLGMVNFKKIGRFEYVNLNPNYVSVFLGS